MSIIFLPSADGSIGRHILGEPEALPTHADPSTSRLAYAAAHIVADPLRADATGGPDQIDWDATLHLRHRLWDLGLGVAEAMDTAQRGMGLDWPAARELARRTVAEARTRGAKVVVGIATDQLPAEADDLSTVRDAYLEQLSEIEGLGGEVVLMASRNLVRAASGPEDYVSVYDAVLKHATRPVVLHWLGEMFDPALAGYWGHSDPLKAMDVVTDLITAHAGTVRGIKMSLLDADLEGELRRRLPAGVHLFTGDDYHYTDLIAGDGHHHSDALLGAFAVVGRHAAAALARLDAGDEPGFREILAPTEPLSQLVFAAPTRFYKIGVAWLSYLNGAQDHFRMIGGFETGRSLGHLGDLVRAADATGYFTDPDFTARRAAAYFSAHGIG
ncbi:dihydrodipicolinate synthase family protein [Streptomyces sp. TG1A-8]|uniref:dihydrodipicolinate synthase family protein n=1 Tax=Streptomyces sp. TG1A-8 TaxID=3051385 RepID=UPI00265C4555|nr:dihydrodipicolinate synthase family protein [Streptomyces sp. TG1A-8]MDO0929590.1 dihydrodipicolinate synthase family protein [Streptomyces sp. TG1A-8]